MVRGLSIYSELWQVRISNVVSCQCGLLGVGIPNVQHLKLPQDHLDVEYYTSTAEKRFPRNEV